jgi:hypothetical protein
MQVSHGEGLATHTGPESCRIDRKAIPGSVDRGTYGQGIEPRNRSASGMPTMFVDAEGNTGDDAMASHHPVPRGRRPLARTEALCAEPGRSCRWPRPTGAVRVANPKGVRPR